MVAVLPVADGTDSQYNMDVGIPVPQHVNRTEQVVGTLFNGEFFFRKEGGRPFLTVIDDYTRCLLPIDMVGAEGQKRPLEGGWSEALNGMQDAGRIIHGTIGVHRCRELCLTELIANAIGKTGADQQYPVVRLNRHC